MDFMFKVLDRAALVAPK